ncbi:hypothetical protein GCM10010149_79090 [Nonomuraea roseoviolacea subsp. roseoviolacea]
MPRGSEVTALTQDADGVEAALLGPGGESRLTARFPVGRDGGRGIVRKPPGIGFPGPDGKLLSAVADVTGGVHRFLFYGFLFYGAEQQRLSRDTPIIEEEAPAWPASWRGGRGAPARPPRQVRVRTGPAPGTWRSAR